jgi:hypothetical protein
MKIDVLVIFVDVYKWPKKRMDEITPKTEITPFYGTVLYILYIFILWGIPYQTTQIFGQITKTILYFFENWYAYRSQ